MIEILINLTAAAVLYVLPGYIVLSCFNVSGVSRYQRFFLSLGLSLVIVPVAFIVVANFYPFIPGLWQWGLLVVILLGAAFVLRHYSARRSFELIGPHRNAATAAGRWEQIGFLGFTALFTLFVNLPRLSMFINGNSPLEVQPWDEQWHVAQLVSVARTGIPPMHYFFPTVKLAYYYASWIYPAILGNLPWMPVSLIRAMSIHTFVQVFVFLGLISVVMQANLTQKWARVSGLLLFTVFGGFDLYAKLPGIEYIDWWQKDPSWIIGKMQISQFVTLYSWVPHHIAGAMSFVLVLLFWKNVQTHVTIKVVSTAIFMGFCFVTSPFVFLMSSIAIGIVLIAEWKQLWAHRKEASLALLLLGVCFLVIAWSSLLVYAQHRGTLDWNGFRVSVFERFRGGSAVYYFADRAVTILGLPLVGSVVLWIDMGLAFVLYLVWWGKHLFSSKKFFDSTETVLLALFPLASLLLVFLIHDQGGGRNFAMRGMIPAQIIIVFAALQVLEVFFQRAPQLGWRKWVAIYVAMCFMVAQGLSALAEVRSTSVKTIELALWEECGVYSLFKQTVDYNEYCLPDDAYRYIFWLNQNTPLDALVLETGTLLDAPVKIRWLERNRLLVPDEFSQVGFQYFDLDFIQPDAWEKLNQEGPDSADVLEWYNQLDFRYKDQKPVYLVVGAAKDVPAGLGMPVYEDEWVKVFALNEGDNTGE